MLEASNPEKSRSKKPSKPGNKPQQRFWPILPNLTGASKEDKEDSEEQKAKVVLSPNKSQSTPTPLTPVSDCLQQMIVTDNNLSTQPDTFMSFMSSGGSKHCLLFFKVVLIIEYIHNSFEIYKQQHIYQ